LLWIVIGEADDVRLTAKQFVTPHAERHGPLKQIPLPCVLVVEASSAWRSNRIERRP
jgi:hypothetical protein